MNLLPSSSSKLERGLASVPDKFNPPDLLQTLWNPDTCPVSVLPWLAWALSVDEWDHTWSVERKREVIKASRLIHQHKGTTSAIRRALAAIGQPDAEIIERCDCIKHNGVALRDGKHRRGGPAKWATYRVILKRPITIDQAQLIYRTLDAVKRNCVHLVALDYSRAALRHNGIAIRDGSYTRGIIV